MENGFVIWLTGLSSAGKTTLSKALRARLSVRNEASVILDSDNLRKTLFVDLGFSRSDRTENVRRIAELAKLVREQNFIVIVACISPFAVDRSLAQRIIGQNYFFEIFVDCPLSVCMKRDPKNLYNQALAGKIDEMVGVNLEYEIPLNPDLVVKSNLMTVEEEVNAIIRFLNKKNLRIQDCA